MKNLNEYFIKLQELTNTNLELLKALNDSFYTKSEHIAVNVDGASYTIPSFIHLENKINSLQADFENLVNAPLTGDAAFNFNGNTQSIELKGFTNTPMKAFDNVAAGNIADAMTTFSAQKNKVFKDFMTPTPYVRIDMTSLPDDILSVSVKKIIINNDELRAMLDSRSGMTSDKACAAISYTDVNKMLYSYAEDADYETYNKVYSMPVRDKLGTGTYTIQSIKRDWTDADFNEHYTLVLDTMSYYVADETIQRTLSANDYLVTRNDKMKLKIESVDASTNTVTVSVMHNAYADLTDITVGDSDMCHLKYFSKDDVSSFKYIDVPLEENPRIIVFIAPIQRNTLIQAAWGDGFWFNVDNLKYDENTQQSFRDYYDSAVTNIGDKLFGVVSMLSDDFVNMTGDTFNTLSSIKPVITESDLVVTQVNKHLNNSETVKNIYDIYSEKSNSKAQLNDVQRQIDAIKDMMNKQSFDNATSNLKVYEDQLNTLTARKRTLTRTVTDCITRLSNAVADTDTPIDNPKYHIRGMFDFTSFETDNLLATGVNVIKIDVEYRYKNIDKVTGNAETIGSDDIFSDWCVMPSMTRARLASSSGSVIRFALEPDNSAVNEPSFNQLDIPITQGETVDIRLRVVYSTGFPFVRFTSSWSDIINIAFPDEYKQSMTVVDIISENNDDARNSAFDIKMDESGIIEHVDDRLIDQNITFFHQPDHIASGFYTSERRVIPLKDKLKSISDDVTTLKDEVFGTYENAVKVTFGETGREIEVVPFANNTYITTSYADAPRIKENGNETNVSEMMMYITLTNTSEHNVRLFSIFPGTYTDDINENSKSKYDYSDYAGQSNGSGDWVILYTQKKENGFNTHCQKMNQWITFRLNNPYNGDSYISNDNQYSINDKLSHTTSPNYVTGKTDDNGSELYSNKYGLNNNNNGAVLYPYLADLSTLTITNGNSNYQMLRPGESLRVPMMYAFNMENMKTISKTISFDLRTSLFNDLSNYTISVVGNNQNASSSITTTSNN